jgi:DNA-directed RNA polymerase specialized sigma24 family protein
MLSYFNGDKTDGFKKLYRAHSIIADISERIDALYVSATSISPLNDGMPKNPNPKRFEGIMVEIMHLKELAKILLKKRAEFDVFICDLSPFYRSLLDLRCDECRSWKEISSALDISTDSVKRIYKRVCDKAEERGLFDVKQ